MLVTAFRLLFALALQASCSTTELAYESCAFSYFCRGYAARGLRPLHTNAQIIVYLVRLFGKLLLFIRLIHEAQEDPIYWMSVFSDTWIVSLHSLIILSEIVPVCYHLYRVLCDAPPKSNRLWW